MRPHLRPLIAGLGVVWCTSALALEPAGGAETPTEGAAVALEAEEGSVSGAADPPGLAAEQPRSWLRGESGVPEAPESDKDAPGGNLGMILAAVVLLGLAGAALYARSGKASWLRPPNVLAALSPTQARVLSSVKLGPKASLVTVALDDRFLLLGVTEQSVANLGWLEPPEEQASVPEVRAPISSPTPVRGASSADERFGDALGAAFRLNGSNFEATGNVASVLADRTEDVVERRQSRRSVSLDSTPPREPAIETQVAGLARRRR